MRTTYYLTLILSFTLLFASCKKEEEDAAENTPTTTTKANQDYTVDLYLNYSGDLRDGSIVKYNDKDGVEQQETLDKTKTEWKKTIVVKKGFKIWVRGEFNIAIGKSYQLKASAKGKNEDGSHIVGGKNENNPSGSTIEYTANVQYKETI